uniref:Sugar phosphate transporter domain-containing protein n=2 Tax=Chrysotila carterae TaxID=13221 RepID=A0A7S4BPF5_CHRCT
MLDELRKSILFLVYLLVHLISLLLASASQKQPGRTIPSALVAVTEALKLLTSALAVLSSNGSRGPRTIFDALSKQPLQLLRVCVPALLYAVQNNLIYLSLSHVDAVTFQITYQLKILFSLLSGRLLLKRAVSRTKWLAVTVLTLGVMLVQLSLRPSPVQEIDQKRRGSDGAGCSTDPLPSSPMRAAPLPPHTSPANDATDATQAFIPLATTPAGTEQVGAATAPASADVSAGAASPPVAAREIPAADSAQSSVRRNRMLGLAALLVSCFCSGLGGASMELLLKSGAQSLPMRNLQMAFVSVLIGLLKLWSDRAQIREGGLFQGFSRVVWATVTLDASNGLLVSALLKYTSAVLKNFAAPLGIILNFFISRYALSGSSDGQRPNRQFVLGTLLVLLALGMYSSSA